MERSSTTLHFTKIEMGLGAGPFTDLPQTHSRETQKWAHALPWQIFTPSSPQKSLKLLIKIFGGMYLQ